MKWMLRCFVTLCVSIGLAVGLSLLPELNGNSMFREGAVPAQASVQLKDSNLVDMMVELPIQLDLYKVSWEHHILSIDLLLTDTLYSKRLIEKDLLKICEFGMIRANNIKDIRVRVMLQNEETEPAKLVLAMDMTPSSEAAAALETALQRQSDPMLFLQSYSSLTYTMLWEDLNPS